MFLVFLFVLVNVCCENGDDMISSLDSEDDVDVLFMVEGVWLYLEDSSFDRIEYWLSRDVSLESDGDDGDDIGRFLFSGCVWFMNYDIFMDVLCMILLIWLVMKLCFIRDVVSDDVDDVNVGAFFVDEDDDFYLLREVFGLIFKLKMLEMILLWKLLYWLNVWFVCVVICYDE